MSKFSETVSNRVKRRALGMSPQEAMSPCATELVPVSVLLSAPRHAELLRSARRLRAAADAGWTTKILLTQGPVPMRLP